jgi:hypothetical protein
MTLLFAFYASIKKNIMHICNGIANWPGQKNVHQINVIYVYPIVNL